MRPGIGEDIFTQGDTFEALVEKIKEVIALHFEEKLEQRETLQVLILTETEVKGKLQLRGPRRGNSSLPNEEIQRRKALVERILKMREGLPPLGKTTAELVHLAREERNWLYES